MTTFRRGDVVLAYFPFSDMVQAKKRPALVVQSEDLVTEEERWIVAQISGKIYKQIGTCGVMMDVDAALRHTLGL